TKYIQHPAVDVLNKMLQELARKGRGVQGGFYAYANDGTRRLWEELAAHFPPTQKKYDRQELAERFLFAQVIEAVWCMQEGVIDSIPAANLGSIYGWGFPAFKGGVIQYVHDYGLDEFLKKCKTYEKRFGQRFRVPKLLKSLIEQENFALAKA
ncbi:MAG: 3-hydroxybutyryl-CoA epimerase, partial [Bacteroidota bacterium]